MQVVPDKSQAINPVLFNSIYLTMMKLIFTIALMIFVVELTNAQEITLPFKGVTLNANLEFATHKNYADGVILMTHSGLAHNGLETMQALQSKLKQFGYNTLAINLSLGLDNRHGMYDCKVSHHHRYADAAEEIGAWLAWLKKQGVAKVVLLGHSRGAGQTALYAAEHKESLVNAVILLAPDTQATNDASAFQKRHNKPLSTVLEQAQKLVTQGKGDTVLEHTGILYCTDTTVSANTIISYYGNDPRLDTPYLIPKIKQPTLVLIAGNDEVVVGFDTKFSALHDGKRIFIKTLEGADHFLRDLYADDAVDEIKAFLINTAKF